MKFLNNLLANLTACVIMITYMAKTGKNIFCTAMRKNWKKWVSSSARWNYIKKNKKRGLTNPETYGIMNYQMKEAATMLKYYVIYYTTYWHGKEMGVRTAHAICDESKVDNWRVRFTWENLAELRKQIGLHCAFTVYKFRKGRLVSFDTTWPWQEPKEWKGKELDIEVRAEWIERNVSIQEVMEWHDSSKAIQYLKERGLTMGG